MLIPSARRQEAAQRAARTDDEGDHGCAVATSGLEPLNELLDLPYLDLKTLVSLDAQRRHRYARAGHAAERRLHCRVVGRGGTNVLFGFLYGNNISKHIKPPEGPMSTEQRPQDSPGRRKATRGTGWERELSVGAAATYVSLCVTHVENGVNAGATLSICVEDGSRVMSQGCRCCGRSLMKTKEKQELAPDVRGVSPWRGFVRFYGGGERPELADGKWPFSSFLWCQVGPAESRTHCGCTYYWSQPAT